jgi:ribosomal protein S18 acetylase RimI-like enzyme
MIDIKKVGPESISIIQNLANITWPVAYGDIITPQQLDYMMELIYSKSALQKQMEKGQQFIIAYDEEHPVAFASYSPRENHPAVIKLHKIYILPNQQGKGIGKSLINYVIADIAPVTTIQLNVNRNNKALHFYQKLGFKIIGEENVDIGNDFYMNDYVMELKCRKE